MNKLDIRAKREWNNNCCEGCFQPLRDCLCDEQIGCGACGEMISVEDQDENGFHDPELCGANDEIIECNLCGNEIKDITKGAIVEPWGATCEICLNEIKGE